MTERSVRSDYQKHYMTGYTGHVPTKNERFGHTSGHIQAHILDARGLSPELLPAQVSPNARVYSEKLPHFDKNKSIYGNKSRFAKKWACGPSHMINQQRVPGYTGHIKGLHSENLFSNTYSETTQKTFTKRHPIGNDLNPR